MRSIHIILCKVTLISVYCLFYGRSKIVGAPRGELEGEGGGGGIKQEMKKTEECTRVSGK
jgi:hypothetical protein